VILISAALMLVGTLVRHWVAASCIVVLCPQDFAPKYNELSVTAAKGDTPYVDKLLACAGTDSFMVRKQKPAIKEAYPTSTQVSWRPCC
jgi:hypothetical protein